MFLIFALRKHDFDFPFSGHLFLYNPRYCWVPKNKCSTFPPFLIFCCTEFLSALLIVYIGVNWISSCINLLIKMFHCLLYFIYCRVLSFWTAGRLLFGRFVNYNIKIYTRWFTWKNPQWLHYLSGASSLQIIKENVFFIKFGFSWIRLECCGVKLKIFFRVGAAKSSFTHQNYLMFQWF